MLLVLLYRVVLTFVSVEEIAAPGGFNFCIFWKKSFSVATQLKTIVQYIFVALLIAFKGNLYFQIKTTSLFFHVVLFIMLRQGGSNT